MIDFMTAYNEDLNDERDDDDEKLKVDSSNPFLGEWKLTSDYVDAGKKNRLSGVEFTKGEFKVCVINSSEYEMVGEYDYNIVADDRKSVEEFIKDFEVQIRKSLYMLKENDPINIEDVDSVEQTM